VSDLVGVDGNEERGDDCPPSPGRLGATPAMTVDLDIKKIGEHHRRQPQKQRQAAQGRRGIAGSGRPRLEGEVIERRMHVGGGAGHDVRGGVGRHAPREGLVRGQLLEAQAIDAQGRAQDQDERETEHGATGGGPGGHGSAGL
jgi:hypothetical protein